MASMEGFAGECLDGASGSPLVPPVISVLRQLATVIAAMSDEQYQRKPVGNVASSVGAHVRHLLDHVGSLLRGIDGGEVDYDRRERGGDVETCRHAALKTIFKQKLALQSIARESEGWPIRLSVLLDGAAFSADVETTVGRELAFLLSHTVHHNALIAVIAKDMGVPVPDRFGYAPATIAYMEKAACVR